MADADAQPAPGPAGRSECLLHVGDAARDGDGLCLFAKRLERGRFIWPKADGGTVLLSRAQLSMLLEGIDWRRVERTWAPEVAV